MSNGDPFHGVEYGLSLGQSVDGHTRGEHPEHTLARLRHEAEVRKLNDRMLELSGQIGATGGGHGLGKGFFAGLGEFLRMALKVSAAFSAVFVVVLSVLVAIPATRYHTLWWTSELVRVPLDVFPAHSRYVPPIEVVSDGLSIRPTKARLTVSQLRRFDFNVLKAGKSWTQMNAQERRMLLAAYRGKTAFDSKEEFLFLRKDEMARFDEAFSEMINDAAAKSQAVADRATRLLGGIGDLDDAAWGRLGETSFSGNWRSRIQWLSNQLMFEAERARRMQGYSSISL